jgi:hypothetical protein
MARKKCLMLPCRKGLPQRGYGCLGWRLCENATGYFGKRNFFYLRVPHWSTSGFQLEKIQVGTPVASGRGNKFSPSVTIGCFHTASVESGQSASWSAHVKSRHWPLA